MRALGTLLAGLFVASLSAPAQAEFFDNNRLSHRIGFNSAGWWRATVTTDYCASGSCTSSSVNALTYGPYVTYLPPGDSLAITSFGATASVNSTLRWGIQVYDAAARTVLKSKTYSQGHVPDHGGFHYHTILPFVSAPGQNIEVRTYHWGKGTLDQCGVQLLNERDNKIQEISPITDQWHQVGYAITNPWETETSWEAFCTEGQVCQAGYLSYGPYWDLYNDRTAAIVALFNLTLGYTDVGSAPVATIDVTAHDNGVLKTIASKTLTAADFPARWTNTKIPLMFDVLPSYRAYEYRVYWHGRGLLQQKRTKLFDPYSGRCMW